MIRAATASDLAAITDVVIAANMFTVDDIGVVDELLRGRFENGTESDWRCLVLSNDDHLTGVAYAETRPATDRVWDLTLLGVHPGRQGRGDGTLLLTAIEQALTQAGCRVLVIDTSATAEYDQARAFYTARGYIDEAHVRHYWADGDDLVIFTKRLSGVQDSENTAMTLRCPV